MCVCAVAVFYLLLTHRRIHLHCRRRCRLLSSLPPDIRETLIEERGGVGASDVYGQSYRPNANNLEMGT